MTNPHLSSLHTSNFTLQTSNFKLPPSSSLHTSNFKLQTSVFSVDVEDYYHVSAFESHIERSSWGTFESRVADSTRRLLDLLDEHQTTGTFFVLGWVAEHAPDLVREIAARGHEIGSHSYWHRLVYQLTPDQFRSDLRRSKAVLEDLIGAEVTSYRAPSFSITRRSLWALEILVEEGIRIDSSIFPTRHDRYGIPDADPDPHVVATASGDLIEFPPTVLRVGKVNVPVSGGGYFRLKPWTIYRRLVRRVLESVRPFMFYIHPWELDPEQPDVGVGSRMSRFRHYLNLDRTAGKLKSLLQEWTFGSLSGAAGAFVDSTRLGQLACTAV